MDRDVLQFAQVMGIIISSVASFIAIGLGARFLWRLGSRPSGALPSADSARLAQLERSVDAIAIEVERISEGQRYTVQVLSERLPARVEERLGAIPPRSSLPNYDTPH